MKLTDLNDVLVHELKDLYSAEKQLVDALPKVAKAAKNARLRKAIEDHLEVTKEQLERLEKIGTSLGKKLTGHTCEGMKGLIEESSSLIEENEPGDALDAALIAAAQRVEHYEIAAYGSAVAFAKELGRDETAKMLQRTLDEEGEADKKLSAIAESTINERAVTA